MTQIQFKWQETAPLVHEVRQPLEKVSFEWLPHGRLMSLTLWRFNGTGLRVRSEMCDLAERTEVGVLSFDLVPAAPVGGENVANLGSTFAEIQSVSKLIIQESGSTVESGLWIQSSGRREILILPSSFPHLLAVRGLLTTPHIFEPEYPLERYEVVKIL